MVFEFLIQLKNIDNPPVWRLVLVPSRFTFDKFHKVIQAAFGWEGYHLYQFSPSGYQSSPTIHIPHEGLGDYHRGKTLDARIITIAEIFKEKGQLYSYIYDFGDDWDHSIKLMDIHDERHVIARLALGEGACPPEDCGGPWGYKNMLEVLKNPKDDEYKTIREWLGLKKGQNWDVNHFDIEKARKEVFKV